MIKKQQYIQDLERQLVEAKKMKKKVEDVRKWKETLPDWQKDFVEVPPYLDVEIIEEKLNKLKNG